MALEQARVPQPDVLANLLRCKRPLRFHQHDAAGFGKTGLPLLRPAIYQFHELGTQSVLAKHIGQANNGLPDRANALDDFRALLEQQFELGLHLHNHLLHMNFAVTPR
jgi:hypothetical protein